MKRKRLPLIGSLLILVGLSGYLGVRYAITKAQTIKCQSTLRAIGSVIQLYMNENHGAMPPSFKALQQTHDLPEWIFRCPLSDTPYIYRPPSHATTQYSDLPDDYIIAYDPAEDHGGRGFTTLFGNGRVELLSKAQLTAALTAPRPSSRH